MSDFELMENVYSDLISQILPIPDIQNLTISSDELIFLEHPELKLAKNLVSTEILATSRCSRPKQQINP